MRKISDYKDADALDLLADLMEPAVTIMADDDVRKAFETGSQISAVKVAIKSHKNEVMQILARLDETPVEEFHCNILTLPARLLVAGMRLIPVFMTPP